MLMFKFMVFIVTNENLNRRITLQVANPFFLEENQK